ncbi:MAG: AAA family ATPase [Actinobacteria bacterium]|nr:AAA family ATPase [Actinomycetota bacterium]
MDKAGRDSLFENKEQRAQMPLAAALRPKTIAEVVGHKDILGEGGVVNSILNSKHFLSLVFSGPPGTGKTTIAGLIAKELGARFVPLLATSLGVKEIKEAQREAIRAIEIQGMTTVIFIDEIHRLTRVQSDSLLSPVEDGEFVLFGATTENPWMSISQPLLSRLHVVELQPLGDSEIAEVLSRAASKIFRRMDTSVNELIYQLSGGDLRSALNIFEAAYVSAIGRKGSQVITITDVDVRSVRMRVSKGLSASGHFEMTSALIKSMRASESDAALYWLARLLVEGEDPRYIARRLVIFASEDVGLADPQALLLAHAVATACETIGMPEIRINLAHAVAYLCRAGKSKSAYNAINRAIDVAGRTTNLGVPQSIRGGIVDIERSRGKSVTTSDSRKYFPDNLAPMRFLVDEAE